MKILRNTLCLLALTACAKHAEDIVSTPASKAQYASYNCVQIRDEMQRVADRALEVGTQQEKTASNDDIQMGVGLVLFWPTLLFLDGNTPQAAEYARLQGEFEALEKTGIEKECHIRVKKPVIEKPKLERNTDTPAYPQSPHH